MILFILALPGWPSVSKKEKKEEEKNKLLPGGAPFITRTSICECTKGVLI